jgi:hypothetical protein
MHAGRDRWMNVGRSAERDAARAGGEAAQAALAGRDAALLVVFCSHEYDHAALLAAVNEQSGGAPLIGCSTAGEIATDGPGDSSAVVVAFGGEGFCASTSVSRGASSDLRAAGAAVAGTVESLNGGHEERVLLLLTDGLAGDQQEVVRGAYGVAGAAIPLVGGCAGDGLEMKSTVQFHGSEVLTNAVVGAALGSDGPLGIGVRHGWRKVGEPMLVTKASYNRVYSLAGEPALDVYLDRLGAPPEARSDAAAFTRFALTHPLGLDRRSGEEHVRFIGEADFEERSIVSIAEVPQGGLAWFMEGDSDSVLRATDAACGDAVDALGGATPLGVLAFDCIARRGVLGEGGIKTEVERVSERAGNVPVAGFYTYGEIARTRGISGFHNQTLVVMAVG